MQIYLAWKHWVDEMNAHFSQPEHFSGKMLQKQSPLQWLMKTWKIFFSLISNTFQILHSWAKSNYIVMLCCVCKWNKSSYNPYNFIIWEQIWVKLLNVHMNSAKFIPWSNKFEKNDCFCKWYNGNKRILINLFHWHFPLT